ncbi:hypothetical protein BDF20DRAFT_912408 [Mycotypha africana]|uniref:uncharacterized protein n=1 Tax=Mycotypha africana TaxID=64632 RepID=UPI002301AAF3|nr:uncharacterized protein BDF20DRAFT_912408 [Mycotypha africana]KAI8982213.1 hypothetical protein BDF20DRAFT_912408 [Mycotypha africana]
MSNTNNSINKKPEALHSKTVNPANLLELQVLTKIVTDLQKRKQKDGIRGSIPYLAKIVQIVENQTLEKPSLSASQQEKDKYYKRLNELRKVQADAYAQLADAYFRTQNFILCESNLSIAVKHWEKLLEHDASSVKYCQTRLKDAYEQLAEAYEQMGKENLAQHMKTRKAKLLKEIAEQS